MDLPPVISEPRDEQDSLERHKDYLSDLMLPCRGTLTAVQQNRMKARQIYNTVASKYFDSVNSEGRHVKFEEGEFSTGRLDIRLNKNITNSEEYRLLKKRIFKMLFLPMLMEYGQRSNEFKNSLLRKIELERHRKHIEKEFEFSRNNSNVVTVYGGDTIIVGDPIASISNLKPVDQSMKVDESIESVISMASKSVNKLNKKYSKNMKNLRNEENPEDDDIEIDEATTLQIPDDLSENTVEKGKRTRKKKTATVENEEAQVEEPSRKKKKNEERRQEEDTTVQVVVLNPEVVANPPKGAYKPRWVKKNMKNREEPPKNPEEMTLADLLFVRGRRTSKSIFMNPKLTDS